ncbi:MAG: lipocalin family protein [Gemmatimonadota bacterium]
MDTVRMAGCMGMILFTLLGCSQPETNQGQEPTPPAEEQLTFVNKVWRVAESNGMSPGQLIVFLSEGTLVFASPNDKPAFGTWIYDGSSLTMVEEGRPYKTDILELSETELRTRSHNPNGFVDTRFVPG